jgi:colicin import membrane protein
VKTRPADTALAVVLAVGLHLLLFALALFGLWWTQRSAPPASAGEAVEAELVDARSLSAATRRALAAPPAKSRPLPAPSPSPPPAPPPQPVAQQRLEQPDAVTRQRTTDLPSPLPAAPREDRDRQRQAQVDLTDRARQKTPEQRTLPRPATPSPMEQQRLQQLADLRRAREQSARQSQLAQQQLQQIADAQARAASDRNADQQAGRPPAGQGTDTALQARYADALREAIRRNWIRPDNVPLGSTCTLLIRQIPGGEVVDVQIGNPCAYDAAGRRSVEAAVWKAQPLPYAGFESVFARTLTLKFTAADP